MVDTIVIAILAFLFICASIIVDKLENKLTKERSKLKEAEKAIQCKEEDIKAFEARLKEEQRSTNKLAHKLEALQADYERLSFEYRELENKSFTIDTDNLNP